MPEMLAAIAFAGRVRCCSASECLLGGVRAWSVAISWGTGGSVVAYRTAGTASLGLLVSALIGCSSGSDTADVQGIFDWDALIGAGTHAPQTQSFHARDGSTLFYRSYGEPASIDLILIHGSGAESTYLSSLAAEISRSGVSRVWTPDVRGHGASPARRGDIDYIDQLEDDLADLILWIRSMNPRGVVVVGGHSSGGGLAIRFAGGAHSGMADGYVLLAPFLQYDAPTVRPDAGGWAMPRTSRIVGLNILNAMGVQRFNGWTVLEFNLPFARRTGNDTLAYSYRLMEGFAPRNYVSDLHALEKPTLVLAGLGDEAFFAEQFPVVFGAFAPHARVELMPDATHLGLLSDTGLPQRVVQWLDRVWP